MQYCIEYGELYADPCNHRYGTANHRALVVESPSKVDAFCVAVDYLTKSGLRIRRDELHTSVLTDEEVSDATERGVPRQMFNSGSKGDVAIIAVGPYKLKTLGQVIQAPSAST